MLTAYLTDALTLEFVVERPSGPLSLTGKTVKAALVNAAGTAMLTPVATCSPSATFADFGNGVAVAVWTAGSYPLLTLGQCQLEVSVTDGVAKVTWPRVPVQVLQGFT